MCQEQQFVINPPSTSVHLRFLKKKEEIHEYVHRPLGNDLAEREKLMVKVWETVLTEMKFLIRWRGVVSPAQVIMKSLYFYSREIMGIRNSNGLYLNEHGASCLPGSSLGKMNGFVFPTVPICSLYFSIFFNSLIFDHFVSYMLPWSLSLLPSLESCLRERSPCPHSSIMSTQENSLQKISEQEF